MAKRHFSVSRLQVSLTVFITSLALWILFFEDGIDSGLLSGRKLGAGGGTAAFPTNNQKALSKDPPPVGAPYGAIVIAAQQSTELDWTKSLTNQYSLYPYNVDDINNVDPRLRIPANKGREAMVYLSWIIDNYENLPWAAVFVHGHSESWHQPDPLDRLVHGLNRTSLARAEYVSLRCYWAPSCPAEIRPNRHDPIVWGEYVNEQATERAIAGNWVLLFPHEKIPETIASPCCAQFAVTRRAIRRRPKRDYERLRDWLLETLLPDEFSGRVLEKLWAYLFTGNAVHCPHPQQCMCEYFTDQCDRFEPEKLPKGIRLPTYG